MKQETQTAITTIPEAEFPSVHLVARNPVEMAQAKTDLQGFLAAKVKQCDQEEEELLAAFEVALRNNWASETLRRHSSLARKRGDFYRKVELAVKAGYTIVPNFPVDIFAVRVKRESPKAESAVSSYSKDHAMRVAQEAQPQILPPGEGRYVSNSVQGLTGEFPEAKNDGTIITKYFFDTTDFRDVQFPMQAARPEVMSAASEAMALRLFDSIGICPQTRRGDPLIIGKVLGAKNGFQQKEVSFLIAWYLDLRTL